MDIRNYFRPKAGKGKTEDKASLEPVQANKGDDTPLKKKKKKKEETAIEKGSEEGTIRHGRRRSSKKLQKAPPVESKKEEDEDFVPTDTSDDDSDADIMDLCESDDLEESEVPEESEPEKSPKPQRRNPPRGAPTPSKRSADCLPLENKEKRRKTIEEPDGDSEKAQKAVATAISQLPPESELNFSIQDGENLYWQGGDDPPNHGCKDIPQGHPRCLEGNTFVVSGVLDSLTRAEAEELIKKHSGRITKAVSGKTSFLVCGQNSGQRKYKTAKEKGVGLMDEDGLLSLISAAPVSAYPSLKTSTPQIAVAPPEGPSHRDVKHPGGSTVSAELWVDKYKPKSTKELVGNASLIQELRKWVVHWKENHGDSVGNGAHGKKAVNKKADKKAVLISGSPGIGKTSTARIIAEAVGMSAVEVNASLTRNKSDSKAGKGISGKLSNSIRTLTTNCGLEFSGNSKDQILIMDEVDGMGAGDRGGISDLIETIKKSKIPIICICNDKYSQKLRSLRNHCMELDYRKPTTQMISKRMVMICEKEGLKFESNSTLELLIESAGGDLRLILGQLQALHQTHSFLSYDQVKGFLWQFGKDKEMGPFKAAEQLLNVDSHKMSIRDRVDLVFQDMDLVPLLVQENYLNHISHIANNDETQLACAAKAAELISDGDIVNRLIRSKQEWSLLPSANIIGTVAPASYMCGRRRTFHPGEMNFPRFTAYLGNMSRKGKQTRRLDTTADRMAAGMGMSLQRSVVRLDCIPALKVLLTRPLLKKGEEGIPEVIDLMHACCLSKAEFDFILEASTFKTKEAWGVDPYSGVETRVKSTFTRQFNKSAIPVRTSIMLEDVKKGPKKSAKAAADAEETTFLGGEDPEMEETVAKLKVEAKEEDSEEDLDAEAIQKSTSGRVDFVPAAGKKRKGMEGGSRPGGSKAARGRGKGRGKSR